MEEQIAHAAGAVTPQEERIADLAALIREAGRIPDPARHALQHGEDVPLAIRLGRNSYVYMAPVFYDLGGVEVEQVTGVPYRG